MTPRARLGQLAAQSQRLGHHGSRLLEVGEVDRVVDVPHRVAVAKADLDAMREGRSHGV